jgi:hypothetical protein
MRAAAAPRSNRARLLETGRGFLDAAVAGARFLDIGVEHRIVEDLPPGLVGEAGRDGRHRVALARR